MRMGREAECNTDLALGLGDCAEKYILTSSNKSHGDRRKKKRPHVQLHVLFPKKEKEGSDQERDGREGGESERGGSLSLSTSRSMDEEEGSKLGGTRKKLRLTTEQVTLLEDSFREHHILNPVQKQGLADRLNIQPRQVEVWFQNRRARTKLKQTEVDCEYLKKRCDRLSNENRRLRKELQELEAMTGRPGSPLYMHLMKAAKLTMCPSCQQVAATGAGVISKTGAFNGVKDRVASAVNGSSILSL